MWTRLRWDRTVLADLGVGWVVADCYKMPCGLEREYTSDSAGAIFAGQPPIFEGRAHHRLGGRQGRKRH